MHSHTQKQSQIYIALDEQQSDECVWTNFIKRLLTAYFSQVVSASLSANIVREVCCRGMLPWDSFVSPSYIHALLNAIFLIKPVNLCLKGADQCIVFIILLLEGFACGECHNFPHGHWGAIITKSSFHSECHGPCLWTIVAIRSH